LWTLAFSPTAVGAKDKIKLENKDNLILIQFKIKLLNNSYRSISYLQTVNFNDLNDLTDIFIEFWSLRDEDYISLNPSHIVYTYKIINDHNNIITTKINRSKSIKSSDFIKFKGFNLPNTMDFL
jgi:hypothetical protein